MKTYSRGTAGRLSGRLVRKEIGTNFPIFSQTISHAHTSENERKCSVSFALNWSQIFSPVYKIVDKGCGEPKPDDPVPVVRLKQMAPASGVLIVAMRKKLPFVDIC